MSHSTRFPRLQAFGATLIAAKPFGLFMLYMVIYGFGLATTHELIRVTRITDSIPQSLVILARLGWIGMMFLSVVLSLWYAATLEKHLWPKETGKHEDLIVLSSASWLLGSVLVTTVLLYPMSSPEESSITVYFMLTIMLGMMVAVLWQLHRYRQKYP